MGAVLDRLLDLVFPRTCPFCGAEVDRDLPCPRCQETLPWLTGEAAEGDVEFVDGFASALEYRDEVKDAIWDLKFHRKLGGLTTLSTLVTQCAQDHMAGRFDLVTWVSLSPRSFRERGFDQSQELAGPVAGCFGLRPTPVLTKANGVARQSTLESAAARRANVLGAYSLRRPGLVEGRRVLLVDDVITTGATISECARVMKLAGARQVWAVSLARGGMGQW